MHPSVAAARTVELSEIAAGNPRWNARDRWPHRDTWEREDYKDYLYAILRFGTGMAGHKSPHARMVRRTYRDVFGEPLRDPRIDNYEWPGLLANKRRFKTKNRRRWQLIPKEGAA